MVLGLERRSGRRLDADAGQLEAAPPRAVPAGVPSAAAARAEAGAGRGAPAGAGGTGRGQASSRGPLTYTGGCFRSQIACT